MNQGKPRRIPLDLHGLTGRVGIFRISGAEKRSPAVESWLNDDPSELRTIAQRWFARMRECGEDVREALHDGCPVACVADAPFGYVNAFKGHVNVGFFNGAALDDPAHLLVGSGKRMRHVKLTAGGESNVTALSDLVNAAYMDIKACLDAERGSENA